MTDQISQLSGNQGDVADRRFGIVVSSYHRNITNRLLEGAVSTLRNHNVLDKNLLVVWVPGAWEIPLAIRHLFEANRIDAAIALGCVIRGQTTHDQHINTSISQSIQQLSMQSGRPIGFGVLTCNTTEQAVERAGGSVGNKGEESTLAVIQMIRLADEIAKREKF